MLEPLLYIFVGFVLASVAWFFYFKNKNSNLIDRSVVEEKEDYIKDTDLLNKELEGKLLTVQKEVELLNKAKDEVHNTLKLERENAKEQLKTINNVENWRVNTERDVKKYEEYVNDTKNFVDKLTGNVKYQGDFGEKLLVKLLEIHGLSINTDFTVQEGSKVYNQVNDELLQSVRPDVIMNLSKEDHVVVDSKVSLIDWKNFVNEKNDEKTRKSHLKKHISAIDKHITTLSGRNYQKILDKNVFPSVILFIPFVPAYLAAIEEDTELMDRAYKKNVIIACPGSLLPVIKIIETIKSKDKQMENVKEISKNATFLIDKFVSLKKSLKSTIKSFRDHALNLQKVVDTGWGSKNSLEKSFEKFQKKHGLNEAKDMPTSSVEEDQIIDIDDPEDKTAVN
tara:strand:- start:15 stop:1199 length:1185 start_codon:yes stop_codon:yes gene_type:complete